jgi:hypothetical protein
MRHHLLFLGGSCFTTATPGERWSCMHWWNVGMQRPPVTPASSCCKLFCKTTCWSHGKGCCSLNCNLSMDSLDSFEYASWVITCCACPPSCALLGRIDSMLKEQCYEACLNTCEIPGDPATPSCILLCDACPCAFMLQACLFDLLLSALPACPCMCS